MKVVDCFTFFNELDLLEYRLDTLDPFVDHFIIVESTKTFTGDKKPLHYSLNKRRFKKWHDKIIHVIVTDMPDNLPQERIDELVSLPEIRDIHWVREHHQRRAIPRGLSKLKLDYEDIILCSDLDEIPDLTKLDDIRDRLYMGPVIMDQRWFIWNTDLVKNMRWVGGSAIFYSHYIQNKDIFQHLRNIRWDEYPIEFTKIECGWHLSWFGNPEFIKNKMFSFAHTETATSYFNRERNIVNLIKNALPPKEPNENSYTLVRVEEDDTDRPPNVEKISYFNVDDYEKVYDCVMFNDELDILKFRLDYLNLLVDNFIIIESTQTHSGKEKPLYFQEYSNLFSKYDDKIISVVIDGFPETPEGEDEHWFRENYQRNMIKKVISTIEPRDHDVVMISDVDEIPDRDNLNYMIYQLKVEKKKYGTCRQRWFHWNYDWNEVEDWPGTQITTWGYLKNVEPQDLRNNRFDLSKVFKQTCGWHLSWFGPMEQLVNKLNSFAHQEIKVSTAEELIQLMNLGRGNVNQPLLRREDWNYYPEGGWDLLNYELYRIYVLGENPQQQPSNNFMFNFI
jgi:beta-1,4-mannosyl-glycoprotein beta-1,4-N-acetylglucosaminyltransferase